MSFTAERCTELISSLKAMHSGGDGEGRKAPRVSLGVIIKVRLLVAERLLPAYSVRVRDISATGMSFVHDRPVKQGSHIVFSLPSGLDGEPLHVLCEVRHCRLAADRVYTIGMCFLQLDYVPPAVAATPAAARRGAAAATPAVAPAAAQQTEIARIRNAVLGES